jgi:hypothetical protein
MSIEVKVTLDSTLGAFIRSTDAGYILNLTTDQLNSWAKPKNFASAKLTAYSNLRKNGVWFNLTDVLAIALDRSLIEEAGSNFTPLNGTWSSPNLVRTEVKLIIPTVEKESF